MSDGYDDYAVLLVPTIVAPSFHPDSPIKLYKLRARTGINRDLSEGTYSTRKGEAS